jgi:hypothetical protein
MRPTPAAGAAMQHHGLLKPRQEVKLNYMVKNNFHMFQKICGVSHFSRKNHAKHVDPTVEMTQA